MMNILISKKAARLIEKQCSQKGGLEGYSKSECGGCGKSYQRFKRARSDFCCECRKKNRLLKHGSAVVLQEGFPAGPFGSLEEIRAHLDSDEITCLLCGNGFKSLPAHLSAIHGTTALEYKERFGIPVTYGLVSRDLAESRSQDCKDREIGKDGSFMEVMRSLPKRHRDMNLLARAYCNKALAKAVSETPNHIAKKTDLVSAYCSDCGGILERKITEYAATVQGCRVLCASCQKAHRQESERKR